MSENIQTQQQHNDQVCTQQEIYKGTLYHITIITESLINPIVTVITSSNDQVRTQQEIYKGTLYHVNFIAESLINPIVTAITSSERQTEIFIWPNYNTKMKALKCITLGNK